MSAVLQQRDPEQPPRRNNHPGPEIPRRELDSAVRAGCDLRFAPLVRRADKGLVGPAMTLVNMSVTEDSGMMAGLESS